VAQFVTSSVAVLDAAIVGKINSSDKIMLENQEKREKMEIKDIFT